VLVIDHYCYQAFLYINSITAAVNIVNAATTTTTTTTMNFDQFVQLWFLEEKGI
jgi:hypothetical protein